MMQLIQLSFGRAAGLALLSLNQISYSLDIHILDKLFSVGNGFGVACLALTYDFRGESKGSSCPYLIFLHQIQELFCLPKSAHCPTYLMAEERDFFL